MPYGTEVTSGPDGRFTFEPFQDLLNGTKLYAHQGMRATASAVQSKPDGNVTLILSNNALVKLQGDLRDRDGKPFANAEVALSM